MTTLKHAAYILQRPTHAITSSYSHTLFIPTYIDLTQIDPQLMSRDAGIHEVYGFYKLSFKPTGPVSPSGKAHKTLTLKSNSLLGSIQKELDAISRKFNSTWFTLGDTEFAMDKVINHDEFIVVSTEEILFDTMLSTLIAYHDSEYGDINDNMIEHEKFIEVSSHKPAFIWKDVVDLTPRLASNDTTNLTEDETSIIRAFVTSTMANVACYLNIVSRLGNHHHIKRKLNGLDLRFNSDNSHGIYVDNSRHSDHSSIDARWWASPNNENERDIISPSSAQASISSPNSHILDISATSIELKRYVNIDDDGYYSGATELFASLSTTPVFLSLNELPREPLYENDYQALDLLGLII